MLSLLFILLMQEPPKVGEWICQATHTNTACSVVVWHKDRKMAWHGALEFCEERCGAPCIVDGCWEAHKEQ